MNEHCSYEKYNDNDCEEHDDSFIQRIGLLGDEFFDVLLCSSAIAATHRKISIVLYREIYYFRERSEGIMNEKTLNKLKITAMDCASNVLSHVELSMMQSKLKSKYQLLGQHVYEAIQDGRLDEIKDDSSTIETVGAIFEIKKQVAELEQKLSKKTEGPSEEA